MHGNKKDNPKLYHLYEIIDKETDGTFKYGISGDPISSQDNLSKRVRDQVSMGNLYDGWLRYYGRILLKRIKGNRKAREIEDQYLEDYFAKNGCYPVGNRDKKRKK